jgi:hypothetical protein
MVTHKLAAPACPTTASLFIIFFFFQTCGTFWLASQWSECSSSCEGAAGVRNRQGAGISDMQLAIQRVDPEVDWLTDWETKANDASDLLLGNPSTA